MNLFQEDVNKVASWLNISKLEKSLKLQIFYPCNMGMSYATLKWKLPPIFLIKWKLKSTCSAFLQIMH